MSSTFLLRKRILINVYLLESCNSVLWHRNLASLVSLCNEGRLSEDLQFGSDNSFFFFFFCSLIAIKCLKIKNVVPYLKVISNYEN